MIASESKSRRSPWIEDGGTFLAAHDSYHLREQIKRIAGARYDGNRRAWILPRSPVTARDLLSLFPDPGESVVELAGLAEFSRRLDPSLDEPLPFESPIGPRWQHQTRGARWLAQRKAALLQYGMRTGKTRATLDALRLIGAERVVVLAPLRACSVWEKEAARHHPGYFRVLKLDSGPLQRRRKNLEVAARNSEDPLIVALNYEASWRPILSESLIKFVPDVLVLDEIHRIKGAGAKQSLFAARLSQFAGRRWGLSGTPLAHSPVDAYGIFRTLDRGIFGTSIARFRSVYCIMGGFGGYEILGYQNLDDFRERYFSITLAATRSVLDLPEAIHETIEVEIPPESMKIHNEIRDEAASFLELADEQGREVVAPNVLTRLLRMAQVASGHVGVDAVATDHALQEVPEEFGVVADLGVPVPSTRTEVVELHRAKELAFSEILSDLDPTEAVVVFCRFRHDFSQIERATKANDRDYRELSGKRNDLDLWLQEAGGEVLAVQYQAGGEGIDLSRASYCVLYDDVFSLAQNEQAICRVHGPGSKNRVVYFHLVAKGTADEYIRKTLASRRDVIRRVLDERSLQFGKESSE